MTRTLCCKCGKKCYGNVLKASGRFYHKECFQCEVCKKNLEFEGYFEWNDKLLCLADYRKQFVSDCRACGKLIQGEAVSSLGYNFHRGCFCCHDCKHQFTVNDKATLFQGHFYCQNCSPGQLHETPSSKCEQSPPNHVAKKDIQCNGDTKQDSLVAPITQLKESSSPSHQSKAPQVARKRWSVDTPCLANSTTDVSTCRNGRPSRDTRCPFQFGQHLNHSYLQIADALSQPRLRRSLSPAVNRSVSPHFHVPSELQNSNNKLATNTNSRASTVNVSKGTPHIVRTVHCEPYSSLPRLTTYSSINFRSTKTLFSDNVARNGYSASHSHRCISDITGPTRWDTEDPGETAKEARYLAMFPSATRPSSEFANSLQPVEKSDWPAPPDPSVVFRDKNKYKAQVLKQPPIAQPPPTASIRSSATIKLADKKEYIARREALRQSKMAHFATRTPSPSYTPLNKAGREHIRDEEEETEDNFTDCLSRLSDQNDSDEEDLSHLACTSTSCYEDARSVLTGSVDILATSSMAKAIRMEQAREQVSAQSVESLTAYVVSASRSPNADQEPKIRTRYDRHDAASPSRDIYHPVRISCNSKLQSMEYVNSGNRNLSVCSSRGTLNQPPVNSFANVLQSYEEIRPQYLNDLPRGVIYDPYIYSPPQSAPPSQANPLQCGLTIYPSHDTSTPEHRRSYNVPYSSSMNKNNSAAFVSTRDAHYPYDGDSLKHSNECLHSSVGMDLSAERWKYSHHGVSHNASTMNSISTCLSMVRSRGDELTTNYPYKYATTSRSRGASTSAATNDWSEYDTTPRHHVSYTIPRVTENEKDVLDSQANQDYQDYRGLRPVYRDTFTVSARRSRAVSVERGGWRSSASTISNCDKTIPYDDLVRMRDQLPKEIDRHCLEAYLPDEDFYIAFSMPRENFYQLPKWRQNDLKRRVQLF